MASYVNLGNGTPPVVPLNPYLISGSVSLGDVVYQVAGADWTVARADADNASALPPIGVVMGISSGTAMVGSAGVTATGYSGLTRGATYWLDTTPGKITSVRPASNAYVVGTALSETELLIELLSAEILASGGGGGGGSIGSAGISSTDGSLAIGGTNPVTTSGTATVELNTVAIAKGGTGQTAKTDAFDALAPTTTKGDLIISDGTDNVRLAAGTNGQVLRSGASAPSWQAAPASVSSVSVGSTDASFATSGGPVTGSGSIDVTLNTVAVADGGTGLTSAAEAGAMLVASGSGAYVSQNVSPFQRNRLVNGAHMVSQRNADTPVQPNQNVYTTDRWVGGSNMLNSVVFDGTGDYLRVNDNVAFDLAAQNWTIECWFYLSALPTSGAAYGFASQWRGGASLNLSWICSLYNNAGTYQLFFAYSTTGTNTISLPVNMASAPTVGLWYHVAFVRSGNNFLVFLNGTQVGSTQTLNATIFNASTQVWIGAQDLDGAGGSTSVMNGYISNLRIVKGTAVYTSNFTPSQIPLTAIANTSLLTCAASTMSDLSANNFTVTPVGNAAVNALNPFRNFLAGRMQGWSNYFDGSGDYLVVPDSSAFNFGSGDFTIECWVQMVGTENPGRIINYWNTSTTTAGSWQILSASGSVLFFTASANGVTNSVQLSASGLTTLTWYHVAVVRSGSSFSMYINGNLAQSATASVTLQTANTVTIGARRSGASYVEPFNGYVSNARIVKGTALYTSNFTPLTTPLVPVANTSLLTCGSEIFQDQSQNNFTITPVGNAAVSSLNPFTAQAPTGSVASLRWSVTSAASALASQYAQVQQRIEGTSVYDFAWGTASAKAVTLSFWVRSPLTGTYCASIQNAAQNRSYVAEYTVSAANTWEKKVIQITGDTSGTWPTSTSESMRVMFDVGSGTNFNTTAGAWQAGNYSRTTNQTNFIGTALSAGVQSNDFAISNVQLELGSVATPFEFRPMQAETALCQRYYARLRSLSGNYVGFGSGTAYASNAAYVNIFYPVTMRSGPGIAQSNTSLYDTTARQVTAIASYNPGLFSALVQISVATVTQNYGVIWCGNNNPNAYVELNAEL